MPTPSMAAPPIAAEPQSKPSPRETSTIVGAGWLDGAERCPAPATGPCPTAPAGKLRASVTIMAPDTQLEVRALIANQVAGRRSVNAHDPPIVR
jgi:hypothetical protein